MINATRKPAALKDNNALQLQLPCTFTGQKGASMEYSFTILGRLDNLNDYTSACRRNAYAGNKMKRDNEERALWAIRQQLRGVRIENPVELEFYWYEKNKRRDHDNVSSFGRKVIQDALVKAGVLEDDGWDYIDGFRDVFLLDRNNLRIEIIIKEI